MSTDWQRIRNDIRATPASIRRGLINAAYGILPALLCAAVLWFAFNLSIPLIEGSQASASQIWGQYVNGENIPCDFWLAFSNQACIVIVASAIVGLRTGAEIRRCQVADSEDRIESALLGVHYVLRVLVALAIAGFVAALATLHHGEQFLDLNPYAHACVRIMPPL